MRVKKMLKDVVNDLDCEYYRATDYLLCDGYQYNCRHYTPFSEFKETNPELCIYYDVITRELERISQDNKNLTPSVLEELLVELDKKKSCKKNVVR